MAVYNNETGFYARDSQVPFIEGGFPPRVERHYMNRTRFLTNYCIVPGFMVLCGLLIAVAMILVNIDEEKYSATAILLFAILVASCVTLLAIVPKMRKLEIAEELKRYDLTPAPSLPEDSWTVDDEGVRLKLSQYGIEVNEQFYWYNHVSPKLATSNYFNRIWLALQFGTEPLNSVFIPLTPEAIAAVNQFSIPLENKEAFLYLLEHKEKVFHEIYNTGTFHIPDKDAR
ncbi:MAG: hypothetical protein MR473_00155 [Clostridiales bacterium]|nr:hypothetical protein [Clostridiales bacterium]